MSTTRRAPLASIPNATNSPHRTLTTSTSKRSRALANISQQENEPPQKKQMLEKTRDANNPSTPRRRLAQHAGEGRVFDTALANPEANAFQKKLVAACEKSTQFKVTKNNDGYAQKDAENIRQWQRHYRKIFPSFSFYFESIPEDMRNRFTRQAVALGACEEKFFSKAVTHIVTTRPIPPELDAPTSSVPNLTSEKNQRIDEQPQTINPLLLDKASGTLQTISRTQTLAQSNVNGKRETTGSTDILVRGRQMGMKIWTSEKFQRILASVLEDAGTHGHNTRGHHATQGATRIHHEDLSQALRNEKLGTSSEREQATLTRDVIVFKGPFIYIHDIDEKVRPTMVREYPKVIKRGDGDWPQFRTTGAGKCPFVEDASLRRELEQERRAHALQQHQQEAHQAPRTRSLAANETATMEPPRRQSPRKALQEVRNFTAGPVLVTANVLKKPLGPPSMERQLSFPPAFNSTTLTAAGCMRPPRLQYGGEPAASGIQRSNLTSAIQSQMISSTAATQGTKATTSKEVNELHRKVFERSHTGSLSVGSMPSSHRMTDITGTLKSARAPAPQRAAKSKAQEKLGGIQEENDPYGDDMAAERAAQAASRKKKPAKRDPKPGYCENCRDKYEDFEEHTVSRKHRKFAVTASNWTELDELLSQLQGP